MANTHVIITDSFTPDGVDPYSRVFKSPLPDTGNAMTLVKSTAYFVYVGRTTVAMTPQYVEIVVNSAGAQPNAIELGIFSSTSPPNKSNQTLTKIEASGSVGDWTATGIKRNSSALSTSVPANTYLWAGARADLNSTMPQLYALKFDYAEGFIVTTASAAALTGAGPWTGSIITYSTAASGPDIRITMD